MRGILTRTMCIVCAAVIILGLTSCRQEKTAETDISDIRTEGISVEGDKKYAQNADKALWVNGTTGEVRISDTVGTTIWSSYPCLKEGQLDFAEEGRTKAVLAVNAIDQYNNSNYVSSYDSSVSKGGLTLKEIDSGVIMIFDFPEKSEEFTIPLKLVLDDGGLNAEILSDRILTYGDAVINTIDILPYLGSAAREDDGYFLVPDGSGALIDFKNSNVEAQPYRQNLYGDDPALTAVQEFEKTEKARLPVMGINKNNKGFVSIALQGASNLAVTAAQPNKLSVFGNVCFSYLYTPGDTYIIAEKDINAQTVYKHSPQPSSVNPKIRYLFLDNGADYVSMAKTVREFLTEMGLKKKAERNIPVHLELFGGARKRASFLGIPYKKICVGTTFEEAEDILNDLDKSGVKNISAYLYGFGKNGMYGKGDDSYHFDRHFGGTAGFEKIKKSTEYMGIKLYNSQQITARYDGKTKNSARKISGDAAKFGVRNPMNGVMETNKKWIYHSAENVLSNLDKLIGRSEDDFYKNLYLSDVGEYIYSDFNKNKVSLRDRNELDIIEKLKKADNLTVRGGNLYAACFSDTIIGGPVKSSGYAVETESVPFYAIVMHGFSNISGNSLNEAKDIEKEFLDSVSMGYSLSFKLTYRSSYELKDTALNGLLSTQYAKWKNDIIELCGKMEELNGLGDQFISDYKVTDEVAVTTYEDGTKVYVNYSSENKIADGIELYGKEFKCVRGA